MLRVSRLEDDPEAGLGNSMYSSSWVRLDDLEVDLDFDSTQSSSRLRLLVGLDNDLYDTP